MINPDNRRISGVHSLVGAMIRQAVLDYKIGYEESTGEYPAYRFLHTAGLLSEVDSLYAAMLSYDSDVYQELKRTAL